MEHICRRLALAAASVLVSGLAHAGNDAWDGTRRSFAGQLSGWYWQNDSLYVRRAKGESPVGQVLHTGYLDALLEVQRRNGRIANLTFRFSGGTSGDPSHPANPSPSLSNHGIEAGLTGSRTRSTGWRWVPAA